MAGLAGAGGRLHPGRCTPGTWPPPPSGWSGSEPTAPHRVTRLNLRRYLASLDTRGYARRTIARKASVLRRYFGWARRTARAEADPSAGLHAPKGRIPAAPGAQGRRDRHADRRPGQSRPPRRAPPDPGPGRGGDPVRERSAGGRVEHPHRRRRRPRLGRPDRVGQGRQAPPGAAQRSRGRGRWEPGWPRAAPPTPTPTPRPTPCS